MTHWIVERMVYPIRGHDPRHAIQHWSAGVRVSCDDGRSWVVRGKVRLMPGDSFSTVSREVSAREYSERCARAYRVEFLTDGVLPARPARLTGGNAKWIQP